MAGRSPALIVKPTKAHTATLIFAHGLGDSGAGWMDLAQNWRERGRFSHVKFIFPNAPNIPISINFGMKMPGWYDIKGFDDKNEDGQDEAGLLGSKAYFDTLIETEVTLGIPSRRIVIGGFSQGGAVALLTGLTSSRRLAGVVGMSSYLPIGNKIPELIRAAEEKAEKKKAEGKADGDEVAADRETPIFMGHGDRDPMIKPAWAARSRDAIRALGWQHLEFHTYPLLEHSADPQEIDDLEAWLEKCLPDVPLEGSAAAAASTSKV